MKKFYIFLITLLFMLSLQSQASAHDLGKKKFNFGFSGSFGTGVGIIYDLLTGDEHYNVTELNAHLALQLSPRTELQIRGGAAYYFVENSGSTLGGFDDSWYFNAELSGLFYFRKNPTLWDPYMVVGSGYPKLIHLGVGNRFALSEHTSAFIETIASTWFLDYRIEARAGISFHF